MMMSKIVISRTAITERNISMTNKANLTCYSSSKMSNLKNIAITKMTTIMDLTTLQRSQSCDPKIKHPHIITQTSLLSIHNLNKKTFLNPIIISKTFQTSRIHQDNLK